MWDASADGYARGEGIAAVILKPLSQALKDGDSIECVIRETGVNQDGRTNGITMPSATAQADLIRSTYSRCGLNPLAPEGRPQYFEAHGTGTPAGDPVEAQAVQSVFFPTDRVQQDGRDASLTDPLPVGSIKTIIGHTEGTAGLAGLLKAALAIQHGIIPPNMHFQCLNPAVQPFYGSLYIPTTPQQWPALPKHVPRRVSVNSFGFGGTNCHVIVEGYQTETEEESSHLEPCGPVVISANSAHSLVSAVASLSQALQTKTINLADLVWTLQVRRSEFPFKASFAACSTQEQLSRQLSDWLAGNRADNASSLQLARSRPLPPQTRQPPILAVFTGQGAQWPRMASGLLDKSRRFHQTIESLEDALASLPDAPSWSLKMELRARAETSRIHEAAISQPICTAVQIALVDLLSAAGIRFTRVVGHSSGEIAAAYAAGYLTARDAICIAYYRGLAALRAAGSGRMLAADMTLREAELFCAWRRFEGRLAVAACNSPSSVTLSGDADAVDEALRVLVDEEGVFARALKVDTAYHSHHMVRCSPEYRESLERCAIVPLDPAEKGQGSCTWYSSVHPGAAVDRNSLSCNYWIDNMTNPVLFSQSLEAALLDSTSQSSPETVVALEVGPHPALQRPATDTVRAMGLEVAYSGVLRRGMDDMEAMCTALGFVWTQFYGGSGLLVDFEGFRSACLGNQDQSPKPRLCKDLPAYSWDHERPLWMESRRSNYFRTRNIRPHPLLGNRLLNTQPAELRWRNIFKLSELAWLKGHKFQGQVLFPAQGYVSMAVEACLAFAENTAVQMIELEQLVIHRGLALQGDDEFSGTDVFCTLTVSKRGEQQIDIDFNICSAQVDAKADAQLDPAHLNFSCRGKLALASGYSVHSGPPTAVLPPRMAHNRVPTSPVRVSDFYSSLASHTGLEYTADFVAAQIERTNGFSTVRFNRPRADGLYLHPAMLDVASHGLLAILSAHQEGMSAVTYLPSAIARVRIDVTRLLHVSGGGSLVSQRTADRGCSELTADCHLLRRSPTEIKADIDVFGGTDEYPEIQIEGLTCSPFGAFTERDDRIIFSRAVWSRDISSGVDTACLDGEPDNFNLAEHMEKTDLVTRAVYFYLRKLRDHFAPEDIPHNNHNHQSRAHLTAFWTWAVNHTLARIEAGQDPRVQVRKEWASDTREDLQRWSQRFPSLIDLKVVINLGEELPNILRDHVPALQVLMQDDMLSDYYHRALGLERANRCVAAAAAQITHRYPDLNVIEIGGGTGNATLAILPSIADKFASYTFTDISSGFFEKTRRALGTHAARLAFRTLDISRDPVGEQGFEAGAYDLIVASNVLHATPKMVETLRNCRRLLRPGGYLLLLENTASSLSTEFIFGMLPGWWLGADEGRKLTPLIDQARWHELLLQAGFSGVDVVARDVAEHPRYHTYSVMVSQAIDDHVAFLREPLNTTTGITITKLRSIVVIGSTQPTAMSLARNVANLVCPFAEKVSVLQSVDHAYDQFHPDSAVICLAELVEPVLRNVSQRTLSALQNILCKSTHVLWLTKGRLSGTEPHTSMVLGIARCVMLELPGRPMQFVDCEEFEMDSVGARRVARSFLRLVYLGRPEFKEVLWSRETEVAADRHWNELLPRIKPHNELNNRLNSRARTIVDNVRPSTGKYPLRLVPARNGSFTVHQMPGLLSPRADRGRHRIAVRLSSVCGFKTKEAAEPLYLCFGTEQKSGRQVVALSSINASIIEVPLAAFWTIDTDRELDAETFQLLPKRIIAEHLVSEARGCIWVHGADRSLTEILTDVAKRDGVSVYFSSSEDPIELPANHAFIHPQTTARRLELIAPRGVSIYANVSSAESKGTALDGLIRTAVGSKAIILELPRHVDNSDGERTQWVVELAYTQTRLLRAIWDQLNATGKPVTANSGRSRSRVLAAAAVDSAAGIPDVADVVDWNPEHAIPAMVRPLDARLLLSADKTYFLAGLTGSVGLSLCNWMADNGARYFAVASRNPSISAEAVERLARKGATLRILSADLSDCESLAAARRSLTAPEHGPAMPPVGGVVNGAMVLRDKAFENMSIEDFEAALRPKVQGSLNLEAVFGSQDDPDFFVFLSSASSVLGIPGLANYGAANLFMCGLAQQRRRAGKAASVIDIGALADVGYLTHSSNPHEATELARKHNTKPLSESDLHEMFAEAIYAGSRNFEQEADLMTGIGFWDVSRPDKAHLRPGWFDQPRMSHYMIQKSDDAASGSSNLKSSDIQKPSVKAQLAGAGNDANAALRILESGLLQKIEKALQMPAGTLDAQAPLLSLGMDSLVAIQVRSWIAEELGVSMPALGILASPSVRDLSAELFSKLPGMMQSDGTTTRDSEAEQNTNSGISTPRSPVSSAAADSNSSGSSPPQLGTTGSAGSLTTSGVLEGDKIDLQAADSELSSAEACSAQRYTRDGRLSHGQDRLFFLHRYLADKSTYNCAIAGRIHGPVDAIKLREAVRRVMLMHESLRSCFFLDDASGTGRQGVISNPNLDSVLEHRLIAPDGDAEFKAELDRMRKHEFSLQKGETVKVTVLSQTPTEHFIIIAYHHIVMDGLSLVTFLGQLQAAYSGDAWELVTPSVQAIDLAEVHREACANPKTLQEDIKFWHEVHRNGPAALPLFSFAKTKYRKQPLDAYGSHSFEIRLDAAFARCVKDLCAQLCATPFHLYLASLAAFLSRWLDVSDLCIGIVDSSRPDDGNTETIGYFLNMLALRFRLDGNSSFGALVKQTRDIVFSALAHSTTPFDAVLDHLRVPRDAHHPLFQVAMNYRIGHESTRAAWGACDVEWTDMIVARNPFDIHLDITEIGQDGGVWIALGVQSYMYSEFDAKMLAKSFVCLVRAVIDDPGAAISATVRSLGLGEDSERQAAIALGRGPEMDLSGLAGTLVHQVEGVAVQYANDVAIRDGSGVPITYTALIRLVKSISRSLQRHGVRAGHRVGVYVAPSAGALCAMLAVMRLGAIYVPLDRRNPAERLGLIVADCQPRMLIYQGQQDAALIRNLKKHAEFSVLDLDQSTQPGVPLPGEDSEDAIVAMPDEPACAIYTSGSTGKPKGVIMTHRNLVNQVFAVSSMLEIGRETVLQQSSLGFDCSMEQIFGGLAHGGTVIVVPEEARGDPAAVASIMVAERVTYTVGVPSEYAALLYFGREKLKECSTWRLAVSGGEKLSASHAAEFVSLGLHRLQLVNAYGPAEGTISCSRGAISYNTPGDVVGDPHMGRVMANYSVVIVDEYLQPVPVGHPGEICIGGEGVAKGYINRPDEDRERFLTSPDFATKFQLKHSRLYRTGDLGRILPDGTMHSLGRVQGDSQVQIRGVRVELDEVAAAIVRTAGSDTISDAAVSLRDGDSLVAFVLVNPKLRATGQAVTQRSLEDILKRLPLPIYMRPSLIVPVEDLPRTENGKRDRRRIDALPVPESWIKAGIDTEEGQELTALELQIKQAWEHVLPPAVRPPILGPKSDFFRAGGNSLLLLHLQAALRASFGTHIPLPDLFQSSTLGGMAALLEPAARAAPSSAEDMDWTQEVETLANDVVVPSSQRSDPKPPRRRRQRDGLIVLLTGATGFLGTHLLSQLIDDPRVRTIHCVAIRPDPVSGHPRHVARSTSPKVVEHAGDLGDRYLGLSKETFARLAEECDLLIHNGADVSFLKTYASVRAPNVLSTRAVAEMALAAGAHVHFVSTASVAKFSPASSSSSRAAAAAASTPLPPVSLLGDPPAAAAHDEGYLASKWVSEALLERLAALRGLRVQIHRPVSLALCGDAPAVDIVGTLMTFGKEMAAVPRMHDGGRIEGLLQLASVEEVAGRIGRTAVESVTLTTSSSEDGEARGREGGVVFTHYCGEKNVSPDDFSAFLSEQIGKIVEEWTMERWLEAARKRGLDPLVGAYLEEWWTRGKKLVLHVISES
jgi:hybrid polyketide synthase/nonribosomal peptide synthetase ACE1